MGPSCVETYLWPPEGNLVQPKENQSLAKMCLGFEWPGCGSQSLFHIVAIVLVFESRGVKCISWTRDQGPSPVALDCCSIWTRF